MKNNPIELDERDIIMIKNQYQGIWRNFGGIIRSLGKFDRKEFNPDITLKDGIIKLDTRPNKSLKLYDFPWKTTESGAKKFLTIKIDLNQQIKGYENDKKKKKYVFLESSIEVKYFKSAKEHLHSDRINDKDILAYTRFDIHPDKDACHPEFHMQLKEFSCIRIATPPMDLTAVLIQLVADHGDKDVLRQLFNDKNWKRAAKNMPHMQCGNIYTKIRKEESVRNSFWYNISN